MHSSDTIALHDDLLSALVANDKRLISVAYGILKSRQSAEDVFQDAVAKACAMRSPCLRCPFSYAYRMVYNLALDEVRRRRFEDANLLPIDEASAVADSGMDALDRACQTDAMARMCTFLEILPQRTRTVFIRHYVHGIPQKDIAAEFGISRTLVNFLIKDAVACCQAHLAGDALGEGLKGARLDKAQKKPARRDMGLRDRRPVAKERKPAA
jgi:RNA polymerase sigma-70 factor, ECF subfamily